jgi:hypothetical protein
VLGFGFSVLAIGLTWLSFEMAPGTPIWRLALAFGVIGTGMAFVWSPLTATATRNLPPHLAGASSGVYNTTRQLGAVLGSSGMAAFMTSRIGAHMPPMSAPSRGGHPPAGGSALRMPEFLREPFSAAMSQSILLPAFIALFGIIAALFLVGFTGSAQAREGRTPDGDDGYDDDYDDYVEYILRREPDVGDGFRDASVVSVQREDPIGFAHNHLHADDEQCFRSIAGFAQPAVEPARYDDPFASPLARRQAGSEGAHARPSGYPSPAPYRFNGGEPSRNAHYRADPEDPISGRPSP